MSRPDAFALQNSGLNEFLFAEVGTELNGSPLTILSVLARLGQDPWAEAARWVKLPKGPIVDRLADSISQMPLCPQALKDAHATAARLILLLPSQIGLTTKTQDPTDVVTKAIPSLITAFLLAAVAWAAVSSMTRSAPATHADTALVQPAVDQPRAPIN